MNELSIKLNLDADDTTGLVSTRGVAIRESLNNGEMLVKSAATGSTSVIKIDNKIKTIPVESIHFTDDRIKSSLTKEMNVSGIAL